MLQDKKVSFNSCAHLVKRKKRMKKRVSLFVVTIKFTEELLPTTSFSYMTEEERKRAFYANEVLVFTQGECKYLSFLG